MYAEYEFEAFFAWSNRPRLMYAPGLREEVGYEMNRLGGTKALIISDKGLTAAGVVEMVAAAVRDSGDLELVGIFDDIVQDARIGNINRGAAFYREKGADCMIVVGGGSVMDSAKAINILIDAGEDDFLPFAEQLGLYEGARRLPPHIAFPTTAGTGCEVTSAMVVLDEKNHSKIVASHPYCNADIAMLDPELTVKLPAKITAFTGMDALTHAIEGVTSTSRQPISDAMGLHAVRLIFRYLPDAVKNPEDVDARGYMLIASTLAGMCFINSMTGAVHATAHALGGMFGVPHGLANSIMLPFVMEFNAEEAPERYLMVADAMDIDVSGKNPSEIATAAIQALRNLKTEIGLKETLGDLNVPSDPETLERLAELAATDSQAPYNSRELDEVAVQNLFLNAM